MAIIQDDVSGNCLIITYRRPYILHIPRCTWKTDSKMGEHRLYESGAVSPICKACTSPNIGVANKLTGIVHNGLSRTGLCTRFFFGLRGCLACFLLKPCCFFFLNSVPSPAPFALRSFLLIYSRNTHSLLLSPTGPASIRLPAR